MAWDQAKASSVEKKSEVGPEGCDGGLNDANGSKSNPPVVGTEAGAGCPPG